MKRDDIKRIRKTYKDLLKNLRAQDILDELFVEGLLDEEAIETIKVRDTRFNKTRRLLYLLMVHQSDDIFERFCKVLRECDAKYGYLADALESADISDVKDSPVLDETDNAVVVNRELLSQVALQTEEIRLMRQSYQEEMQRLRNQLTESLNRGSVSHDVVDSGYHGPLKEYVQQYCTTERTPTGVAGQRNPAPDVPDGTSFPSTIWNAIRSTVTASGGRNYATGLSINEIACRIGADVVRHTILSRHPNAVRSSSSNSIKPSSSVHSLEQESAVYAEASCRMKELVVNLLTEKASEFNSMVGQLDISEVDGYATFGTIADEMFGIAGDADHDSRMMNWGRVLVWYAFWAHYASNLAVDDTLDERVEVYGRYVGFFLAHRLNSSFINAQGWEGFNERYRKPCNSNSTGHGLMWRVVTELWRQLPL